MTVLMELKIKRIRDVPLPRYETAGAAGLDLCAYLESPLLIHPQSWEEIFTGLTLEIPEGWQAEIRGRSGLAFHGGMAVLHGVGTIDSDYRGEVGVPLYNHGHTAYVVHPGDRVAQLVMMPAPQFTIVEVEELTTTTRGIRGLGSTGV